MENLPTKANYSVEAQKQKKNYEIMKRYGPIADYLCFFSFWIERINVSSYLERHRSVYISIHT